MKRVGRGSKAKIESNYLSSAELAEFLNISKQMIQTNYFRIAGSCKVGRCRRYDKRKIEENLKQYGSIFKIQEKKA